MGQQKYDDFDANKFQNFGLRDGILDSAASNPAVNSIDASAKCAKYNRLNKMLFDNIKMYPYFKLKNVSQYATYLGTPPKIRLKIYTTAPLGTVVEIQLGKKGDDIYPSGIHSKFQAVTTVQNAWEEIYFSFSEIPVGSMVNPADVDKIVLLFSPNSADSNSYYFDDLIGPEIDFPVNNTGLETFQNSKFDLSQNFPNPVFDNTMISYDLKTRALISLKISDISGKDILNLVDENQLPGNYRVFPDTRSLKNGVYFYTLSVNGIAETKRMLILKL